MIKVIEFNDIKLDETYTIVVPSNKELFYKNKYINNNYNITNMNNLVLDNYNGSKKLANDFVSYIIMYKTFIQIKDELNYFQDVIPMYFVKSLINTYKGFYDFELEANSKNSDLSLIFNTFEKKLEEKGYMTTKMLYEEVLQNNKFNGNYVFIDHTGFDKNELPLLEKISQGGNLLLVIDKTNYSLVSDLKKIGLDIKEEKINTLDKTFNFKILNDISDEVSFVSNRIAKNIIDKNNYEDILIVCPNVDEYINYFKLYLNHPYSMITEEGILTKRFIDVFCDILKGDFSCTKFMELLKLGVFNIDLKVVDKLDNYIYSWDLEDFNFYLSFKYNPNGNKKYFSNKDMKDLENLNNAKDSIIYPLKQLLENIVGVNNKNELLKVLYTYLLEEDIIKNLFEKDEYGVNKLISLFELMNDNLDDGIDLNIILDILSGVNFISKNKKEMQNSIDICDFKNAVYDDKKIIYLVGVSNSNIPYKLSIPELLSNYDINKKDLINNLEKMDNLSYYLFHKALLCEDVTITYPKLGSDLKLNDKCIYLKDLLLEDVNDDNIYDEKEALKKYSILLSDEKIDKESNSYLEKINLSNCHDLNYKISEKAIENIYDKEMYVSPTSVETFFKCPFYHFCSYGLKLKVKEKYTFDNREVGTFIHYILENIIKNDLNDITVDNTNKYIEKYSLTYLEDMGKISNDSINYVIKVLSNNAKSIIKNIVKEMDVTLFKPTYFEFKVNDDSAIKPIEIKIEDKSLKVVGVVDRVDTYTNNGNFHYRIIDYKTGNKKFRLDDVLDGLNLQMILYLLSIKESNISELNIIPSALLYYPALLKESSSSRGEADIEKTVEDRLSMNGIINKDDMSLLDKSDDYKFINIKTRGKIDEEKVYCMNDINLLFDKVKSLLKEMGTEIYKGNISVNPIGDRTDACNYCKYKSICKFDNQIDKKRKSINLKNSEVFRMLGGDNDA